MQIAYAIWLYDPTAEYRLSHSNATKYADILEWRGPGKLPTEEVLQQLWDEYKDSISETDTPTLEERVFVLEDEVKKLKSPK